ncbi:hypothetical protein ACIP5Y_46415 [Nocardia sp. NPDC088792]|uniref:hypothetical protein n=1 Tax=Nocardia sp. NPDC088792 TaxID=3364332 RepID=UPI00381E681D
MTSSESSRIRIDKRPRIVDMRNSGRLSASTRILRADNGSNTPLGLLLESGERPLVWSLDERMRFVASSVEHIFPRGSGKIMCLRTASGRSLEMTADSSLRTLDGWRELNTLTVDDRVAIPRWIPAPSPAIEMNDAEVILLVHMIGDGSCVKRQPIRYASIDEENLAAVTAAATHFGVTSGIGSPRSPTSVSKRSSASPAPETLSCKASASKPRKPGSGSGR